jgi:hypothetical protein
LIALIACDQRCGKWPKKALAMVVTSPVGHRHHDKEGFDFGTHSVATNPLLLECPASDDEAVRQGSVPPAYSMHTLSYPTIQPSIQYPLCPLPRSARTHALGFFGTAVFDRIWRQDAVQGGSTWEALTAGMVYVANLVGALEEEGALESAMAASFGEVLVAETRLRARPQKSWALVVFADVAAREEVRLWHGEGRSLGQSLYGMPCSAA